MLGIPSRGAFWGCLLEGPTKGRAWRPAAMPPVPTSQSTNGEDATTHLKAAWHEKKPKPTAALMRGSGLAPSTSTHLQG